MGARRFYPSALLAIFLLVITATGAELFVRSIHVYQLWNFRLVKIKWTPRDDLRIYNRIFYENHPDFFVGWKSPIEFFKAPTERPMTLSKPNLHGIFRHGRFIPVRREAEATWTSNSWGFRGPEFSLKKPKGTFRIVCLGAATTEGIFVADSETYPVYLEERLHRRFPGRRIEVINAGQGGLGSLDLLEVFRLRVLPLQPDVVIYYEAHNDMQRRQFTQGWRQLRQYTSWSRWLEDHSALFLSAAKWFGWNVRRPLRSHVFLCSGEIPCVVRYGETLRQLVREGRRHEVKIILSSFATIVREGLHISPSEYPKIAQDLYDHMYPFTPGETAKLYELFSKTAERLAKEENVPFADVAAQVPKEPRCFMDLIHLTPNGNRLLANAFSDFLSREVLSD